MPSCWLRDLEEGQAGKREALGLGRALLCRLRDLEEGQAGKREALGLGRALLCRLRDLEEGQAGRREALEGMQHACAEEQRGRWRRSGRKGGSRGKGTEKVEGSRRRGGGRGKGPVNKHA